MAFTGAELVTLAKIAQEEKSVTDPLAVAVDSDTETDLKAQVVAWNLIKGSYIRLKGGRDGLDLDNQRKRDAITREVRLALGLEPISDLMLALDPGAMSIFELEVGSNF